MFHRDRHRCRNGWFGHHETDGETHSERRFARGEHGFGERRMFGRHHRGRHGGRPFGHGDLRFLILQMIQEQPRHGYEIIKQIEDSLGGSYSPSPGVVYPTLTMLEDLGYATVEASEGNKKLYTVTAEGTAFLEANKPTVEALEERLARVRAVFGDGPAPQIVRAMENLRTALRLRLSRGKLSLEQADAVAAAIDAAASAVDKS